MIKNNMSSLFYFKHDIGRTSCVVELLLCSPKMNHVKLRYNDSNAAWKAPTIKYMSASWYLCEK